MNISDDLLCLYSVDIDQHGGSYQIEVPSRELQHGSIEQDGVYRVALMPLPADETDTAPEKSEPRQPAQSEPTPPVEEGDIREVEIEGIGDQGDGVAKIDRGYVVIVPGTEPGDEVTVEMQIVKQNFAIGEAGVQKCSHGLSPTNLICLKPQNPRRFGCNNRLSEIANPPVEVC